MIKTIAIFLSKELWKVTLLAVVAFTLVMTVFAIIEPLRKEGLSTDQVVVLFAYTLPAMVSLTFPIAALFSATIVYGRFSQDNELLACRASGISTPAVLAPGLLLGVAVTVISIVLSNVVAPRMLALGEGAVKSNVMSIVAHRLRRQGYTEYETYICHARGVGQKGDLLSLEGVVVADTERPYDVRFLTTSKAMVEFDVNFGQAYATVYLINPTVTRTGSRDIYQETSHPLDSKPIPSITSEEPSWYTWGKLRRVLQHPEENPEIRRRMIELQRAMKHDILARDIARAINGGQVYDRLHYGDEYYEIRARGAEVDHRQQVKLLSGYDQQGRFHPVEVRVRGPMPQVITADGGVVGMKWSDWWDRSVGAIKLYGNVTVRMPGAGGEPQRRSDWQVGQLAIPPEIQGQAEEITLEEIYQAESSAFSGGIRSMIRFLKNDRVPRLMKKIKAEMHGRVAYGVSCLLMVALGAALGLIFRGGQIISAFAISVVPSAIVIVMMLMGKQLLRNPGVSEAWGLLAIWAGVLALFAANVVIYLHLARR